MTDVFVELHVPDFDTAEAFYHLLGFSVVWRKNAAKGYMVMRRGESILNFYGGSVAVTEQSYFRRFEPDTKRGYGVELVFLLDDIDDYYASICETLGKHIVEPLRVQPWGRKDFRLEDPFGFYLRFGERYDWITKHSGVVT